MRVHRDQAGVRTVTSPRDYLDPSAFLAELREDFALPDYGNFVKFINDSPLDRGRSFVALLGLSAYSEARQALQLISETRQRSVRNTVRLSRFTAIYTYGIHWVMMENFLISIACENTGQPPSTQVHVQLPFERGSQGVRRSPKSTGPLR